MNPHVALLRFIQTFAYRRIETCDKHGDDDYRQGNVEIDMLIRCLDGQRFNAEEYIAFASLIIRYGKQAMLDAIGVTVISAMYRVEVISTDPIRLEWRMTRPF